MKYITICCCFILLSSCYTQPTNKIFESTANSEIGSKLYRGGGNGYKKNKKISKKLYEYIPVRNTKCDIAWVVDVSKKDKYINPHGKVFYIEGIKVNWRYLGDKRNCKMGYTTYLQ